MTVLLNIELSELNNNVTKMHNIFIIVDNTMGVLIFNLRLQTCHSGYMSCMSGVICCDLAGFVSILSPGKGLYQEPEQVIAKPLDFLSLYGINDNENLTTPFNDTLVDYDCYTPEQFRSFANRTANSRSYLHLNCRSLSANWESFKNYYVNIFPLTSLV